MMNSPMESESSVDENEPLVEEKRVYDEINAGGRRSESPPSHRGSIRWIWLHVALLTIYTAIFIGVMLLGLQWQVKSLCNNDRTTSTRSVLEPAFKYKWKVVEYNVETETAFHGPSLPEVDEAWLNFLNQPHELRLSEEVTVAANLSTIRMADGSGDYLVQPGAYHLLHCLFYIYRHAHPEFYEDLHPTESIIAHTDHCVDNLRQFVQCHAGGSGVVTYKWLPDYKQPASVLSTEELCIDWDYFDDWVRDRSIPIEDLIHQKEKHLLEHPTMGVLGYEDFI